MILLIERTLKAILRAWMRRAVEEWKHDEPSEFALLTTVVSLLNLVTGVAAEADAHAFWTDGLLM
jgi:hypothetical protein